MPGGRTSSNDLVLEQLREMLAEWQRDRADGNTIRASIRRLDDHAIADEKRHEAFDVRIRELEEKAARNEGALGTGTFRLPPLPVPPAFPPAAIASKRPSKPSWLAEVTKKPALIVLLALATVLAHAILRLLPAAH
jgi:hypothetical protein